MNDEFETERSIKRKRFTLRFSICFFAPLPIMLRLLEHRVQRGMRSFEDAKGRAPREKENGTASPFVPL